MAVIVIIIVITLIAIKAISMIVKEIQCEKEKHTEHSETRLINGERVPVHTKMNFFSYLKIIIITILIIIVAVILMFGSCAFIVSFYI